MLLNTDWCVEICDFTNPLQTCEKSTGKTKKIQKSLSWKITKTDVTLAENFVFMLDPIAHSKKLGKKIGFQGI